MQNLPQERVRPDGDSRGSFYYFIRPRALQQVFNDAEGFCTEPKTKTREKRKKKGSAQRNAKPVRLIFFSVAGGVQCKAQDDKTNKLYKSQLLWRLRRFRKRIKSQ